MFAYLQGTIRVVEENAVIVLTEFLGFRVFVTTSYAQSLRVGDKVELYLHHAVSEQKTSYTSVDGDVTEALRGLGYSPEEIRSTLPVLPRHLQRVEERVAE